MISDAQKEVLNDLLLSEPISSIFQAMVVLTLAEDNRLAGLVELAPNPELRRQAANAHNLSATRLEIVRQAMREAAAREGEVGTFFTTFKAGDPVQQALL